MICAALLTYALGTAKEAFDLILSIGAGTGLLYLLRWFWWRVSAWSEIAAMASSFVVAVGFFIARKNGVEVASHVSLLVTVGVTTVVWVTATLLAPATDRATLVRFYELVRPAGPGWNGGARGAGVDARRRTRSPRRCSAGCSAARSSTRRSSAPARCSTAACRSSTRGSPCSSSAGSACGAPCAGVGPRANKGGAPQTGGEGVSGPGVFWG